MVIKIKHIYHVSMQKQSQNAESRRVKLSSDYAGFDLFLIKKPLQFTMKIPETILIDKQGAPKDWIFNSGKVPKHPILKKKKENLVPLLIIKSICSKHISYSSLSPFKTIAQLTDFVKLSLNSRKDADYFNKKKSLQIRTVNGQMLQLTLLQFLQYVSENKHNEQYFYQKWRMIQEKVSASKIDQSYLVESVRKNHVIQSKSCKYISISSGNKVNVEYGGDDPFKESLPSMELEVTDTKSMEGYKFFDTYLNKKFYSAVQEFIQCIQKNFKCIVESLTTRFIIDHNREPFVASIEQIYVKPILKLFEMKDFGQSIQGGEIKVDAYIKSLQQFLKEHPQKLQPNLHQPMAQQRRYKCKGEFCDAMLMPIPHLSDQKFKLPLLAQSNVRKIGANLIEAVRKRRWKVIEKLKQSRSLNQNYVFQPEDSSQYEDSDGEPQGNVKVCETCFIFYINVLKHFDVDGYCNLVEKKASSVRSKLFSSDSQRKNIERSGVGSKEDQENQLLLSRKNAMKSLKHLSHKPKEFSDHVDEGQGMKRSASQHARLRPLEQSPRTKAVQQIKEGQKNKKQKQSLSDRKKEDIEVKTNKLIDAKLSNAKLLTTQKDKPQKVSPLMNVKPTNYHQGAHQLFQKLESLPNSSLQEFIVAAKQYFTTNLPQSVDRVSFSSEYLPHLYEFMSNSPIVIAPGNRIKKRPEMTLKRLSQLTTYPQIVSKSTFIFNTLICDQKTTIPFCVISSSVVHRNNRPSQPFQNIFIFQDIFDSFIEYISMCKEILQDCQNTRFVLFNLPGQSHTIYDKNGIMRTSEINSVVDKLIYRLSSEQNQLSVIGKSDKFKFLGFGFGGYLATCFLSSCPSLYPLTTGVALVNSAFSLTQKSKSTFEDLLQLFSVEDPTTEDNAFLFYNKAINSNIISKNQLQDKAGLNSIRLDGRCFLLKNALSFWDDVNHQNFIDFAGKVSLIYSRSNIMLSKTDMQKYLFMPDSERTVIKTRTLIQIDGGHDTQAENYDGLLKHLAEFLV